MATISAGDRVSTVHDPAHVGTVETVSADHKMARVRWNAQYSSTEQLHRLVLVTPAADVPNPADIPLLLTDIYNHISERRDALDDGDDAEGVAQADALLRRIAPHLPQPPL